MVKCSFQTKLASREEWECPCDALPGEEFCYWHKVENRKDPTQEMLEELKEKVIFDVYLAWANLINKDLSKANLSEATLSHAQMQGANIFSAQMQGADLSEAKLQGAFLSGVDLSGADLSSAQMQGAELPGADLRGANLPGATLRKSSLIEGKLQGTHLSWADFREAHLSRAQMQGADLSEANLQKAIFKNANLYASNLYGVKFDFETDLEDAVLVYANLYRSYFDETKSFRYALLFHPDTDKEINEIVGDILNKEAFLSKIRKHITSHFKESFVSKIKPHIPLSFTLRVLDFGVIQTKNSSVAEKIFKDGELIRFVGKHDRIMFFDGLSGYALKNPEKRRSNKASLDGVEGLSDLIIQDGEIQSEFLYKGTPTDLFEASYEIYNNLCNFYIANGSRNQAAFVHYRKGEVNRKLLRKKGISNWLRSWLFDFLLLRSLVGYGDKIWRPISVSGTFIALFAVLFWLTDGIVKNVNGKLVSPRWLDYLYHSITTFTSLGYSNIQPNLAVGSLPQILVAVESVLGILLMALIIFVVTYHVSR